MFKKNVSISISKFKNSTKIIYIKNFKKNPPNAKMERTETYRHKVHLYIHTPHIYRQRIFKPIKPRPYRIVLITFSILSVKKKFKNSKHILSIQEFKSRLVASI